MLGLAFETPTRWPPRPRHDPRTGGDQGQSARTRFIILGLKKGERGDARLKSSSGGRFAAVRQKGGLGAVSHLQEFEDGGDVNLYGAR